MSENATEARPLAEEVKSWARALIGAFLAYLAVTTVAAAQYHIPSESMAPTLEVGDRVLVSKYAYGYSRHSLPLDLGRFVPASDTRFLGNMPARGDVVVFVHPREDKVMIKRLIGLPGDVIEMRSGALYINGAPVEVSEPNRLVREAHGYGPETAIERDETLPGGVTHPIHTYPQGNELSEFGPYEVPQGYLFMMGDNRDNSLDSRWAGMGPAPIENLIGRAETVIFAPRSCKVEGQKCRSRWLAPLHD